METCVPKYEYENFWRFVMKNKHLDLEKLTQEERYLRNETYYANGRRLRPYSHDEEKILKVIVKHPELKMGGLRSLMLNECHKVWGDCQMMKFVSFIGFNLKTIHLQTQ